MRPNAVVIVFIGFFLMGMVSIGALFFYEPAPPLKPLPVFGRAPQFALTDSDSWPMNEQMLQGKVWVADFFFSNCPGPCPAMTANMARLQQRFRNQPDVHLVNFSVDPERDSPLTLKKYALKFQANTRQWHFLTGPESEIRRISVNGFKLGTGEKLIQHSQKFALVDREGNIRGYYEGTDPLAVDQLGRDIERLLRE